MELVDFRVVGGKKSDLKKKSEFTGAISFSYSINILYTVTSLLKGLLLGRFWVSLIQTFKFKG